MKNLMTYNKVLVGMLSLGAFLLAGCSETIDTASERRVENEKAFVSYASNSKGFEKVTLPGNFGDRYIYMKWLQRGSGTVKPMATDNIKMHYEGAFLTNYQSGSTERFDSNLSTHKNLVKSSTVNTYIPGMSIALQNMVVGDQAEVIIPWYLGYGDRVDVPIPAYSALYFKVELLEITKVIQ